MNIIGAKWRGRLLVGMGFLLVAATIVGCAEHTAQQTMKKQPDTLSCLAAQRGPSDIALCTRQRERELREMAQRFALEAEWSTKQSGEESESTKRNRVLARDLQAAADEIAQLSSYYQRQVPHGQVQ
jgi:hypothetical protein